MTPMPTPTIEHIWQELRMGGEGSRQRRVDAGEGTKLKRRDIADG